LKILGLGILIISCPPPLVFNELHAAEIFAIIIDAIKAGRRFIRVSLPVKALPIDRMSIASFPL
jgi:hypothetical protein